MVPSDQLIRLELHGSRAKKGVDLDAFESFITYFRTALRDFERIRSRRPDQVGRGGQPDARSKAATAFRLVAFKPGSGLATLEPVAEPQDEEQLDLPLTESPASRNLSGLLDAVEGTRLEHTVIAALEQARKALGQGGWFAVSEPRRSEPVRLSAETIKNLEFAASQDEDVPAETSVAGRLHLIEVDEPGRKVEIRAGDGVNWSCTYPDELEERVLKLVKSVVWAVGLGRRTKVDRGTMELHDIGPLPKHEQTPLFTLELVPSARLEREQGITQPQGLEAFVDSEWEDDEESQRYLASVLEDSDE